MRERAAVPRVRGLALACAALVVAGCAARMPLAPASPAHPDYVYPAVPAGLQKTQAAVHHERGWRYLQSGDSGAAASEFRVALARNSAFYPALAGQGYLALASHEYQRALDEFDASLRRSARYAPALVGRGQALMALDRPEEAAGALEAAADADSSLGELRDRAAVLRLRTVQQRIDRARASARAGRLDEAAADYEAALAATPESGFLHRELAQIERRRGHADEALSHLRQAVALEPGDAASWIEIARVLEGREDLEGALSAYRSAAALAPDPDLDAAMAGLAARIRDAGLPPEIKAIPAARQVTRGQLAGLVGVRFESVLSSAPARQVVLTDTAGYWAADLIRLVVAAGVMDPFDNHTFQPDLPVRRADLAAVARRIALLVDSSRPELRLVPANRPRIADVTPAHLSYPAVSFVVASGMMPLVDGRFQVSRDVTGAEAVAVIDRLRALAPER